jgi:hypothetical protein
VSLRKRNPERQEQREQAEAGGVRPGHQNVGVHNQRRGQPDRDRRECGGEAAAQAPGQPVSQQQAAQRIQRRHEADRPDIRAAVAVARDAGAQRVGSQHTEIGGHKARRPHDRRSDRRDIAQLAGARVGVLCVFAQQRIAHSQVGWGLARAYLGEVLVLVAEIEVAVEVDRAQVGVVLHLVGGVDARQADRQQRQPERNDRQGAGVAA